METKELERILGKEHLEELQKETRELVKIADKIADRYTKAVDRIMEKMRNSGFIK